MLILELNGNGPYVLLHFLRPGGIICVSYTPLSILGLVSLVDRRALTFSTAVLIYWELKPAPLAAASYSAYASRSNRSRNSETCTPS